MKESSSLLRRYDGLQTSKPAFYRTLIIFKPLEESQLLFLYFSSICLSLCQESLLQISERKDSIRFVTGTRRVICREAPVPPTFEAPAMAFVCEFQAANINSV